LALIPTYADTEKLKVRDVLLPEVSAIDIVTRCLPLGAQAGREQLPGKGGDGP
jgi:hypothetical protein